MPFEPHAHHHAHPGGHPHRHGHDPALPHPSQPVSWSILRMSVAGRLAAAAAVACLLWAGVVMAMR